MINLKLIKWGFGLVLTLGLCACMDMQRSEHADVQSYEKMNTQQQQQHTVNKAKAQKTYASKDPTQKATPGPKRNAAPQIPVIQ
ncbi:hypothetical protein OQJ18_12125 [Fluoribacter dumoffii]|uniref:hypothetical protein n=1 Tax=Fluoribacter dumoffii TaxID=463 RepID=UPI0022444418|nr:hypothetical protein [Fluoribacter dumoffii]MCW8417159.1 hypothetical protein [Fluoribacter dumoffii]MCW8455001.1 hypothetical protein [Fluoribacter dumoffii]MCW8460922.1 hypothetical protein [Fluoribacter dumoffii]MCW8484364.1 hypothetical protein [Fluoribacter dumoffii]